MKKIFYFILTSLIITILASCGSKGDDFEIYNWKEEFGDKTLTEDYKTYDESYNEETFYVNGVEELQNNKRSDFLMAVDASMVSKVYECGGTYYNINGQEQSVWQILAKNGVNAVRFRLWVDYNSRTGVKGGGDLDKERILEMAKEARKVNMKFILDLHYSDYWADPDTQTMPYEWLGLDFDDLNQTLYDYTYETVKYFSDNGITPQYVQVGNEINNGLCWNEGKIVWNDESSYEKVATLLKSGISACKKVNKNIKTIIHLAEGGKTSAFTTFFDKMASYNVDYDVIGASFYTFYHGTLDTLYNTLETVSKKYNKEVFVAEFSYAYTMNTHTYAANIFGENQENNGSYLATIQGQAACISDTIRTVAKVSNNKGLGVCYWESCWLPVNGAGWEKAGTLDTWANQALFTYRGLALPSLAAFKLVRTNEYKEEKLVGLKSTEVEYTLNIASEVESAKTLSTEVAGLSNYDSYMMFNVTWNEAERTTAETTVGNHTVHGTVTTSAGSTLNVTANVRTIQNFIKNPGFEEGKTTQADTPVASPWTATANGQAATTAKILKIQSNKDARKETGVCDLNYYDTGAFKFDVSQKITNLEAGTYTLSVYIMGETMSAVTDLYLYAKVGDQVYKVDLSVSGWASGYHQFVLEGIEVSGEVTIGVYGNFNKGTWGHIDDFELTKA